MSIENIDKAYGSAYHRKNFPHLYQDNYFGSEADIANRKEQGTYVPSEMRYTDEEKADRIGGKYFSGLLNQLSSGLLLGGTQPKDLELQRGGDTETEFDDLYVDKYTGNVFYRQQVPKIVGRYGGIEIPGEYEYIDRAYRDESGQQVTIDPELKAYTEERTDKTGSSPVSNALGVIMIPFDAIGIGSLIKAGGKKLVGLVKNLLPNKSTDEISKILKNTLTDDIVTQIQNAPDKETQLNILQNKLIETENLNTYDKAVADQTRDISVTVAKPENKKIFEYLDNLKQEGNPLLLRKLLDDLKLPSGSKERIRNIVRKYYPNTFAKLNPEELRKVQSDRAKETYAAKRADEDVFVPTPRRLETGKGNEKISQVDFPKGMEEKYIVDLKDIYNNPKSNGTNTMLAEKYFGEATPYTIAQVEKVNNFLIRQQNLIKPIADPSASGKLRQARIKQAEKYLSPEELEIVRRQDRQVTIANKYYAQNPEKILENETFMELLNAKLVNGVIETKDPITLTKAKELTQKGLFDIFHISPVSSEKRNIMFPGNILISPARINQGFNNAVEAFFKKNKNSKQPEVIKNKKAISDFYKKFGLTFETVDGRIGAELSPAINRETNKLTSIDNVFQKMNVEQIIDSSLYVSKQELDKIFKESKVGGEFVPFGTKKAETYNRKKFQEGSKKKVFSIYLDPNRFVSSGVRSNDPLALAAEEEMVTERYDLYNLQEFQKQQREFLSSEKPLKFKFTELIDPRKMADNPLIRRGLNATVYGTAAYFMELAETIANGFKVDPQQTNLGFGGTKDESIPADPDRLQFEEYFPYLHKFYKMSTDPLPETPDEQVYTSAIDELNRGFDRGLLNLTYDIFDLGTAGLDLGSAAFGKNTAFQKALKDSFDKMDKSEPETWLGKISTIATEFGVPGGVAFKIVNRFRKLLGGAFGANLFAESTLGLTGTKYATTVVSNVSKAAGTNALAFGLTDVVAGGPYNAVSEYFGEDPLLFDGPNKGLYQLEDTTNLKGAELALANFRNRLRFGADGAIIGGMFPLVGAGLKYVGGPAVSKIGAPLAGAALTVADELAVKPISYLASGRIKLPFTPAGRFEKDVPILGDALSLVGKVPLVFGEFLGKDILARVGATALAPEFLGKGFANSLTGVGKEGSKKFEKAMKETFTGRLPAYKDWRMFEVTSDNALETGLKRFDNFLGYFRDSGRQSLDRFRITGQTEATIKATQDSVENLLKMVEVRAHDLATGFLKRSNTNKTSPAGEEAMLEQVLNYLKGNIKINQLDDALKGPAQELSRTLNEIKVSFRDILPDGNDLKTLLSTDLKGYIRQSFAVFSNPKFNIIDRAMEAGYKTGKGFVNAEEKLIYENALNYITKQIQKNEEMLSLAGGTKEGLRKEARNHLKEIMLKTRTEGRDTLEIMQNIARENLFLDDLIVRTGDELPEAIKKFLGKQEGLRDSVVTTTASLLSQSSNMRMYQRLLDDGLKNGWIFKTKAEARTAGVSNAQRIASKTEGRMAGITGELQPEITKYFAGPDVAHSVGQSKGGMLDSLYQNFVVQNLIAYKAGVQTMKTVFSPATQTRNFGSAMFFPLNMGHIGGRASVTDAFKIVMDDIFGAGRTANEEQMIRYLKRQKELGVIDENIVVSELQAVLQDIKSGQLKTIGGMAERINNSSLVKGATKLYAGGDNVWKLYGHEFVKSQLKDIGFKTVDEVSAYMKKMFGQSIDEVSFLSNRVKTVKEAIEEAAAYTIRETYPTYSKVPDLVKFFRRMPFVGNFVSFPAEILRTSMATTGYALKHIADDNPMLRQMGYRTLMGQATAVGGAGAIFSGLGHAYTGITEGQIRNYQQNFAPDFMRYSQLMPIAKIPRRNSKGEIIKRKKKNDSGEFVYDKDGKHVMEPLYVNGQFKVFDLSRYLPYDLISSTARSFLNAYSGPKRENLDPSMVDDLVLKKFFMTAGPLFDLAKGTFFGTSIGYEPILPLINSGKDKNGKPIWAPKESLSTKIDKFMAHWFNTVEPGGLSSAQKVFDALQGDVQKGSGMPMELKDELFKLFGGSTVTVDLQSSLKYKVKDFKDTFPEARMTEDYFSPKDYMTRGPKFLIASYNQQNREAFAEQYEFYKTVRAAQGRNNLPEKRIEAQRISDLPDAEREERFQGKSRGRIFVLLQKDDAILNEDQILQVMIDRLGETRAVNILNGVFTPLSTGEKGLDTRRKTIERNNPVLNGKYNYDYFMPIGKLETLKAEWGTKTFEEYETQYMEERQRRIDARNNNQSSVAPAPEIEIPEAPVAPLPDSGPVQVAETQPAAGVVDQATGLTSTESALLDRDEQLIRQRQRGTV